MRPVESTLKALAGERAQLSRAVLPYGAATLVGLMSHVALLGLFTACGVWPMALVNLGSLITFVWVWRLLVAERARAGLLVACLEVACHQVLAVYYCGRAPGFQHYLYCLVPLIQMMPGVERKLRIAASIVPVILFAGLELLAPSAPRYPLPAQLASLLGIGNLAVSFGVCFVFIHYYRRGSEDAERRLAETAAHHEQLLRGILPPVIIDRLRGSTGRLAERFDAATVLFADLVGFTLLAQRKTPEQLVELLDEIFGVLDGLAAQHGVEKIKTIGDAYMVAAGVPSPRPDHVLAVVGFALDARRAIAEIADRLGEPLSVRIGIHTGPLVAGVIGRSKFAYDLWGDVVNTAARMESHGEPGRLHVTEAVASALAGSRYTLAARGVIEVKGKGPMSTYFLEAAPPAQSPA